MTRAQPMDGMRSWLAFSIAIHALILALMIFGLPYFHTKPRDLPPMISVELVQMGKETTTNKVSPVNKVVKQPQEEQPAPPTPPPPQAQQTPPQPEQPPEPQPPQPRPDPQPAPALPDVSETVPELKTPDLVVKAQIPDAPKLAAIEPQVPELTVPKVDLKRAPPKPTTPNFDALLKNLTKEKPQPIADQPPVPQAKAPPTRASGAQAPISANLTASETDAVRRQLDQCMSWPTADQDLRNMSFDVEIVVNPDRTVASAQIVDQSRMGDPVFAAAARAALRAVRMAQCTPLELPPEKYQAWHDMTVTFSPPGG